MLERDEKRPHPPVILPGGRPRHLRIGGGPVDPPRDPIRIVHVDSNATAPGDGSYESPLTSLDDVRTNSQTGDIILVWSNSTFNGESVVLRDLQRLLGEGGNETHTIETRGAGEVTLPETSPGALAGAIPVISSAPGAAVTLGDPATTNDIDEEVSSNEVSNLSIDGGTPRYPVGTWPILDAASKAVLVDGKGRRSYSTSTAYCPSLGEHTVMGYLPSERARVGEKLVLEYFDEGGNGHYPMTVRIVGRGSLFDPDNLSVRG